MRIRALQAVVAFLAITLATMTMGLGTAGADHHANDYGSITAPVESTGHLVVAGSGFASVVNGNTAGPVSGQATAITPKAAAAPAAAAPAALAHTGTEVYLAYAGLGLIAAGAVAMGSRRRVTQS